MTTSSISQIENPMDTDQCVAIIYSISDLGDYLVEIRQADQHYFIGKEQESEKFGNLGDAKLAAQKHGARQMFLALNKTYQEVEANQADQHDSARFDYMPIQS